MHQAPKESRRKQDRDLFWLGKPWSKPNCSQLLWLEFGVCPVSQHIGGRRGHLLEERRCSGAVACYISSCPEMPYVHVSGSASQPRAKPHCTLKRLSFFFLSNIASPREAQARGHCVTLVVGFRGVASGGVSSLQRSRGWGLSSSSNHLSDIQGGS